MGAKTTIGIGKEQRIQGERYARRFGLHSSRLVLKRRQGKFRTIYLIGFDDDDVEYRVRFDKVIRMRKPTGHQVISKLKKFLLQAEEIHADKYSYDTVTEDQLGTRNLFKVKCNKKGHGTFLTHRSRHIEDKKGCPKCGKSRVNNLNRF